MESPIQGYLNTLHQQLANLHTGELAIYIPEPLMATSNSPGAGRLNCQLFGLPGSDCCRRPKTEPLIEVVPIQN